jgi:RHS repeat-associated protein
VINGARTTTYTDRRGNPWTMAFEAESWNLIWVKDPLEHLRSIAYDKPGWPFIHEATSFSDPLSRTWSVEHDNAANVTSSTDPLGNKWTYAYDTLNNLTSVTPPGTTPGSSNTDKQVQLFYDDDANHPTSPTRIVEPAAHIGDSTAGTVIEYYGPNDQNGEANGLVKRISPPYTSAPVATEFTYNSKGNLVGEREGAPTGGALLSSPPAVSTGYNVDGLGQVTGVCAPGSGCSEMAYDDNGNASQIDCTKYDSFTESGGEQSVGSEHCWPAGANYCNTTSGCAYDGSGGSNFCIPNPNQPDIGVLRNGCTDGAIAYNHMGQLTHLSRCVDDDSYNLMDAHRTVDLEYDELGRMISRSMQTNEGTGVKPDGTMHNPISRAYTYAPSSTNGTFEETGPDGTHSLTSVDLLGRVDFFARWGEGEQELASTIVEYTDAGEVKKITYGNGSKTDYTYDGAGRVNTIRHESGDHLGIHLLDYDWSPDGLVNQISESDQTGPTALTVFTYDNRNRLTGEHRTGSNAYWYDYGYDKAGNRTYKSDANSLVTTEYVYDVSDPVGHTSQGNRLIYSAAIDTDVGGGPIQEERWYDYDDRGNVRYATQRFNGDNQGTTPANTDPQWFTGTAFYYSTSKQLWMTRKQRWRFYNQNAGTNSGHINMSTMTYVSAMEYRYDGPTERYLVRPRNPVDLTLPQRADDTPATEGGAWHDYNSGIFADYSLAMNGSTPAITEKAAQVPGLAQYDYIAAENQHQHYLHGNLVGTTQAVTGQPQGPGAPMEGRKVYTAFGEPISSTGFSTRYGYAGAWVYQAAGSGDPLADLGWLHVGYRYYDPSSGRFVQRDPIGIRGGANTYAYAKADPARSIDPTGLDRWIGRDLGIHSYMVFGDSSMGYWRIEMGAIGWDPSVPWYFAPLQASGLIVNGVSCLAVGGIGVVTITPCTGAPPGPPDIVTATEEDQTLLNTFTNGEWVYYDLWWRNCNHFIAQNQGTGTGHGMFGD